MHGCITLYMVDRLGLYNSSGTVVGNRFGASEGLDVLDSDSICLTLMNG